MDSNWQHYLEGHGARISEDRVGVRHFGAPADELEVAASGAGILANLSHRRLLHLQGSEVLSFLQGQLTNDVYPVEKGIPILAAHLTPKGRVIADLLLFPLGDGYALDLPEDLADTLSKRLRMFILNADVTLREVSADWIRLGLAGEGAMAAAAAAAEAMGSCGETTVQGERGVVVPLPGPEPAYWALLPSETAQKGWQAATARARAVGEPAWELARIQAGVPAVHAAISEAFLPQELNLECLEGISYTKGCYTGQEVVARTKHLGRLKRRLYRVASSAELSPGQAIQAAGQEQARGRVVRAAPRPEGGSQALVVLRIESLEAGESLIPEGSEVALEPLDLPYPLSETIH